MSLKIPQFDRYVVDYKCSFAKCNYKCSFAKYNSCDASTSSMPPLTGWWSFLSRYDKISTWFIRFTLLYTFPGNYVYMIVILRLVCVCHLLLNIDTYCWLLYSIVIHYFMSAFLTPSMKPTWRHFRSMTGDVLTIVWRYLLLRKGAVERLLMNTVCDIQYF